MATNFPASLDALTNPTGSDSLSSPSHSAQHANVNDAVEALQAKVGADSSAVTSSLDYKVAQLEAISHGKILQVVSASNNTSFTTTSTSFVSAGANVTITPSSASSTIFIIAFFAGIRSLGGSVEGFCGIYNGNPASGGTLLTNTGQMYINTASATDSRMSQHLSIMDSPATTSAITYYQALRRINGTSIQIGNSNGGATNVYSTITAMEVSA